MVAYFFNLQNRENQKTVMEISKLLFALLSSFVVAVFVHCQDQSGFISLDCGLPEGSNYDDVDTGINYISDAAFINTGDSKTVSPVFSTVLSNKQLCFEEGVLSDPSVPLPVDRFGEMCISAGGKSCELGVRFCQLCFAAGLALCLLCFSLFVAVLLVCFGFCVVRSFADMLVKRGTGNMEVLLWMVEN
ncbi:hypothetical protein Q3G72_019345 [Acer saccharum]|nr:hypothetical protein Q3G72_019345 [Acer saccharum]